MATLIVEVTAECEGVITSLPRGGGWELTGETYDDQTGNGTIYIDFEDDDLSAAAEQALNTNDGVISYRIEK